MPLRFAAFAVRVMALASFAALASASSAFAHVGGHAGGLSGGFAHPFTGLDHMLAMLAVGLWASQLDRPGIWLLPLLFPVAMMGGATLGLFGVAMPAVEIGILLSVLVLGLVVAIGWNPPVLAGAVLVVGFAVLHGHAHGSEWPASGSVWLYGFGFVCATVILHMLGLAIGTLSQRRLVARLAGGAVALGGLVLLVAP